MEEIDAIDSIRGTIKECGTCRHFWGKFTGICMHPLRTEEEHYPRSTNTCQKWERKLL
ncbi:MAG: hypothetical protein AMQ74_01758 [Candidatus Methanofastidiosum methylothiophilum]|uniref:Uncharacterized protein n=1 Tax=Candidatus Methanofastidiosum methylothiophilum TaxID=1705564 RepID=A0A150INX9_9EURY|nr:MAG: hypothetical protein AMQ74_01758 [Candidatus Methanofastidiosum methylthiophilus]